MATVDITISLSYLGTTGSLIQPDATVAAGSHSPTLRSTETALPGSPPVTATQHSSPPIRNSRSTEGPDGNQASESAILHVPAGPPTGCAAIEGSERSTIRCPGRTRESEQQLSGSSPGEDSWTCVYDPRDESLRDKVPMPVVATMTNDTTVSNSCALPRGLENEPRAVEEEEEGAVSAATVAADSDNGQTMSIAGKLENNAINVSPKMSAAPTGTSTAEMGEPPPVITTVSSTATTTPEQDRLSPRQAGSPEPDSVVGSRGVRSGDDDMNTVKTVKNKNDGESGVTEAMGAREIIRVNAMAGSDADGRRYPGTRPYHE